MTNQPTILEIETLRECAGERPARQWGAAVGACLGGVAWTGTRGSAGKSDEKGMGVAAGAGAEVMSHPHPAVTAIPAEPCPFTHPRRPALPGSARPCWLHGGLVALPALQLYPQGDGWWDLRILLEDEGGGYSWAVVVSNGTRLGEILVQWARDPEGTTREVFKRPVPGDPELKRGRVASASAGPSSSSTVSAEDLGL